MTKTSIFLCASMNFYKELLKIENQLADLGIIVKIPVSAEHMKQSGEYDPAYYKGSHTYSERAAIIRRNFDMIATSDAILVINNEKNGVEGYIGPNVLMEIGLAFYLKKKIYIWNPVRQDAPYKEELLCFAAQIINQDLTKIQL